jgi:D-xylose transport system substrate-binding protein
MHANRQGSRHGAAQLAKGGKLKDVKGTKEWDGGTKHIKMVSMFLKPIPVTKANLDEVIKANWAKKEQVCAGVNAAKAPAACK